MAIDHRRPLHEHVTFQRRAAATNVAGVVKGDFADLVSRRADFRPRRAGPHDEQVIGNRLTGTALWDLRVRWDSVVATITTADIVVDYRDTSRRYAIRSGPLDIDGDRRWAVFLCQEGVPVG